MVNPETFELTKEDGDIVSVLEGLLARAKAGELAVILYAAGEFPPTDGVDGFKVTAGVVTPDPAPAKLSAQHITVALTDLARGIHQAIYS